MAATMNYLCIATSLAFLLIGDVLGAQQQKQFKRTLTTEIRCNSSETYDSYPNVIYTKGVGRNDTLHYVLSTIGKPTVLMARTDRGSSISIDCDKLLSTRVEDVDGAIKFESHPLYSQTLLFNRLLEYNDTHDVADLTKIKSDLDLWNVYDLQNLPWKNCYNMSDISRNSITFMVDSDTHDLKFQTGGSISLQFQIFDHEDRADDLPHLQFTANSSQFSLVLDRIETNFTGSRFALEIILVTQDSFNTAVSKTSTQSIDDEHTPGQFEMIDWTFGNDGAFLRWKPVSYFKSDRSLKTATKAKDYPLYSSNLTLLENITNIAYAFYGDSLFNGTYAASITNISFGLSKDKFYVRNHYTAWTASMSYGKPFSDTVSVLIIVVISVGLGLPVVIIIFGGIGVCVKKNRDKKSEDMTSSYSAVQ